MRKILLLMMIIVMGCAGLFAGTVGVVLASAAVETADSARYNFLGKPKLLAASSGFIYLVSGARGAEKLQKIDIYTGKTEKSPEPKTLPQPAPYSEPLHISITGNLVFVFYATQFYTYSTTVLAERGPYSYDAAQPQTAFHAETLGGTIYVYYARLDTCVRASFDPDAAPALALSNPKTYTLESQEINGIAAAGTDKTYLLATHPNSTTEFRIYDASTAREIDETNQNFYVATDLNMFGTRFFFLCHDGKTPKLTAYDDGKYVSLGNDPANKNFIQMKKSIWPSAVYVRNLENIFVIDAEKESIDRYSYDTSEKRFNFENIVAAHRGDTDGYYFDPSAVCVVDENRYLVADRTGVKLVRSGITSQLIERGDEQPYVEQIAFDMWQHIYVYDSSHRIQKYRLTTSGQAVWLETLTNGGRFGRIVDLVPSSDQTIYALDSISNCAWKIEPGGNITEITLPTAVGSATRGVIADGKLKIIPATKLDAVTDALESPVYLTRDGGDYFIESENLTPARIFVEDAAPAAPYSLTLCRLTGKLLWLGTNHSIQSFDLTPYGYWSPKGKDRLVWNDPQNLIEYETHAKDSLYMRTTADAVVYDQPGAIGPRYIVTHGEEGKYLMILQTKATVGGKTFNDWACVLYHPAGAREPVALFVSHAVIEDDPDFATADNQEFTNRFLPENKRNSGRVILRNTVVYMYPSSAAPKIAELPKNYGFLSPEGPGLIISREIRVPDYDNVIFYEVRIRDDGKPAEDGNVSAYKFVGFVSTKNVIDAYAKSSVITDFTPNGRIVLPLGYNDGKGLPVLSVSYPHTPHENEFLASDQQIRIIGKFNDTYTQIAYSSAWQTSGGVLGDVLYGLVLTDYVKPDGITWWQIVAIIALAASVCAAVYIGVRFAKRK